MLILATILRDLPYSLAFGALNCLHMPGIEISAFVAAHVFLFALLAPCTLSLSVAYSESPTNAIGWGYNTHGQLGRGYESLSATPNFVRLPSHISSSELGGPLSSLNFATLSSGMDSVIGIEAGTNRVFVWGSNAGAKLGIGSDGSPFSFPNSGMRRNFPTPLTFTNGTIVTATAVAATDDAFFIALVNGSLATTYDPSVFTTDYYVQLVQDYPGIDATLIPTAIQGISCSGASCAVWNSTTIYCISLSLNVQLLCSQGLSTIAGPTPLALTSVSMAYVPDQNSYHLLASNGSHVWGRYDNNNTQFLAASAMCNTMTQWCTGFNVWNSSFPLSSHIVEVLACSTFSLMRSSSDIFFYAASDFSIAPGVQVFYGKFKTYFPYLRPTSMACSLDSHFITNITSSGANGAYADVLSWGNTDVSAFIGRSTLDGDYVLTTSSDNYNLASVSIPVQSQSLVMAKMSSTSGSPFVLVRDWSATFATPLLTTQRQRQLISWGLNDASQGLSPDSSSFTGVTAVTLPHLDLHPANMTGCSIQSNLDNTAIQCPPYSNYRLYGVDQSTDPSILASHSFVSGQNFVFAYADDGASKLILSSTFDALFGISSNSSSLVLPDATFLPYNIGSVMLWQNMTCGKQTCAALESSGAFFEHVYSWGLGTSNAFPTATAVLTFPSGVVLYNTTFKLDNFELLSFGKDWVVLVTDAPTSPKTIRFSSLLSPQTPLTLTETNIKKVVAGDDIAIWISSVGGPIVVRIAAFSNQQSAFRMLFTRSMSLTSPRDVAAVKNTWFALADSPDGVAGTDFAIYSWSWNQDDSPAARPLPLVFGTSLDYTTLASSSQTARATPQVVNMPFAGIKPSLLCSFCKGDTMIAFILEMEDPTLPAVQPPPSDPIVTELPDYLPYRTCFGLNAFGSCGSDAYHSLSLLPFQRFSPLVFSGISQQAYLTMGVASPTSKTPEFNGTVFFFGQGSVPLTGRPFGELPAYDGSAVPLSLYLPQQGTLEQARPSMIATPSSVWTDAQVPFNASYITSFLGTFYLVDATNQRSIYTCSAENHALALRDVCVTYCLAALQTHPHSS